MTVTTEYDNVRPKGGIHIFETFFFSLSSSQGLSVLKKINGINA